MTRLLSFFTGFIVALVCGSLFIAGFKPALPQFADIRNANLLQDVFDDASAEKAVDILTNLVDETRSTWTESVDAIESLNLSGVFSESNPFTNTASSVALVDSQRMFSDISKVALQHGHLVTEVLRDQEYGWVVVLETGEKVLLGDQHVYERLQRSLSMIRSLTASDESLASVDARYAMGIAVSSNQPTIAMK